MFHNEYIFNKYENNIHLVKHLKKILRSGFLQINAYGARIHEINRVVAIGRAEQIFKSSCFKTNGNSTLKL